MRIGRTKNSGYLPPDKYLTFDEVWQLRYTVYREAAQAIRNGSRRGLINWMLITVMLETGLRAEEICYLQLRDTPARHGKDVILVRRGKGNKSRVVDVKKSMKRKFDKYIHYCRKGAKPSSPLFVTEAGQRMLHWRAGRKGKIVKLRERTARMSYHELYMRIRRIGKRAGIDNLHPHKLRHTYGSHLYRTAKDILNTMHQMGHSRPEITARYAHADNDESKRQAEALYSQPKGA